MKLKKTTKMGTYTVVIALILLAAIALVNMIVSAFPTKYTIIDTSASKLYSISEETEKALKNLDQNVTLYLLCPNKTSNETLQTFLERYVAESSHIKIKIIDPIESPSFVLKYTEDELADYSVIVESDKRFKVVDYNSIYELDMYSYYYYGEYVYNFNGEMLITSAIDYVTTDVLPKIYILTGHSENALSASLKEQISALNYSIADLSLLTMESVPDDAAAVIINVPSADLNEDDAKKLIDYIDSEGKIILFTSALSNNLVNLNKVTSHMGLSMKENIVIEGSTSNCLSGMPYWMIPDMGEHSVSSSVSSDAFVQIPYGHPINITTVDGVTTTKLFTTSDTAYTIAQDASNTDKTDSSEVGSFTVGAIAEASAGGKLLWLGSNYAFTDQVNTYSSGANYKYLMSAISYLVPRDTIITEIPSVEITTPMLTVPENGASFWGVMLTAVIPLAFLATGVVKWALRRRK